MGDIIEYYNDMFVPKLKSYLISVVKKMDSK